MTISCSDCRRIIIGLSSNRCLELADFVAGAVFGEVGGCLCMLRAL